MATLARQLHVNYCKALNNASMLAQRDLLKLRGMLDMSDPELVKYALLKCYPALVDKYGDMAATAAVTRYETARMATMGEDGYTAYLANRRDIARLEAQVHYAMGHMFDDGIGPAFDPEQTFQYLAGTLDKEVKNAGRDTITANVSKDKYARFVRVPDADACDWCKELAGYGNLYTSEEAAGGAGNEYHPHCNCQVEPVFVHDDDEDAARDEALELWDSGEYVYEPTKYADYHELYSDIPF